MKNLEQIRAKNALEAADKYAFKGKNEGDIVKKVPTMILENGILASAAFAQEAGKGYNSVFNAIIDHLKDMSLMPANKSDILQWMTSDLNSSQLRAITSEVMAYLNYLRRFAK